MWKSEKQQYYALNDKKSCYLIKKFIESKIKNQKSTLTTLAKSRNENDYLLHQRNKLDKLLKALDSIEIKPSEKYNQTYLELKNIIP